MDSILIGFSAGFAILTLLMWLAYIGAKDDANRKQLAINHLHGTIESAKISRDKRVGELEAALGEREKLLGEANTSAWKQQEKFNHLVYAVRGNDVLAYSHMGNMDAEFLATLISLGLANPAKKKKSNFLRPGRVIPVRSGN